MRGLLLDCDYIKRRDPPCMRLFVKKDGEVTTVLDPNFRHYFYVLSDNPEKLLDAIRKTEGDRRGEKVEPESVEVVKRKLLGDSREVIKVIVENSRDITPLRREIRDLPKVSEIFEHDVPPARRYLIDHGLTPMNAVEVEGEFTEEDGGGKLIATKPPEPAGEIDEELRIMCFDIESYGPSGNPRPERDPIIMLSITDNEEFKKVLTWKEFESDFDFVEVVEDEGKLLERFSQLVGERDYDVITGYNTDLFDFPYIRERADQLDIELKIGRDSSEMTSKRRRFETVTRVPGRPHIDIYPMVDFLSKIGAIRLINYTLENVYEHMLGESKPDLECSEISEAWEEGGEKGKELLRYSLADSEAGLELALEILPLVAELSKTVKQSFFDVSRMTPGQLVEWLLVFKAHEIGELVPARPVGEEYQKRRGESYIGGYVKEPDKGLHEDLAVLDFRSLYPTIIVTHNIDPAALDCDCCSSEEAVNPPNLNYEFCQKERGFIPKTLEKLVKDRIKLKEEMEELEEDSREYQSLYNRQWALKIIANSFYGMLGYPRARWYCKECAESVTSFGRSYIKNTIEQAEEDGFNVVYGDSVDYSRQIVVEDLEGWIKFVSIGDFVENEENPERFKTLAYNGRRNEIEFRKIKKAISHPYDGKLLKFSSGRGGTVVTPQHSVYKYEDGKPVLSDAKDLKEGDELTSLTRVPQSKVKYRIGNSIDIATLNFEDDDLRSYKNNGRFFSDGGEPISSEKKYKSPFHRSERPPLSEVGKEQEFVGCKDSKAGGIPRFWELSEEFAWVAGYYCSVGSASQREYRGLSFESQEKGELKRIKRFFDEKLEGKTSVIRGNEDFAGGTRYYYAVQREPLEKFFVEGLGMGSGSGQKKVPEIIVNGEKRLKREFLKGYTAGRGILNSRMDKRQDTDSIQFPRENPTLANQVRYLLKQVGGFADEDRFGEDLNGSALKHRSDNPEKENFCVPESLNPGPREVKFAPAKIDEVVEVEPTIDKVYDLEVEGNGNFVDAEGLILVHNTDSLLCKLGDKEKDEIDNFLEKVNKNMPGIMELELEGFYKRGVFITKKRYAMVTEEGKMEVKGLEFVRRDWAALAKRTQEEVLRAVLEEGSPEKAAEIVHSVTKDVKQGRAELEDLIIHTQLKKPIEDYKTEGPHVAAARRLKKAGKEVEPGMTISYIVEVGSGNVGDRAIPVSEFGERDYDADYYIEHQILPAVMRVMEVLSYTEEDLRYEETKQTRLGTFGNN